MTTNQLKDRKEQLEKERINKYWIEYENAINSIFLKWEKSVEKYLEGEETELSCNCSNIATLYANYHDLGPFIGPYFKVRFVERILKTYPELDVVVGIYAYIGDYEGNYYCTIVTKPGKISRQLFWLRVQLSIASLKLKLHL